MPALNQSILFETFEDGLRAGGWRWLRLGSTSRPRDYRIWLNAERLDLKVYLWTLTPGGAHRPLDEWRIQPTALTSFVQVPDALTVILGYEPTRDVFAGFDVQAHAGLLGASPSMQIKENALEDARQAGLSLHAKSSPELVFAIRADLIGLYIQNLQALHKAALHPKDLKLLSAISEDPGQVSDEDIDTTVKNPERRRVLRTVLRLLRDSRFRARVLGAYAHRCAACGVQLDLLDAAHILPVGQPGSSDEVTNGVALCALHHRAYDAALIGFSPLYKVQVSKKQLKELKACGRDGGSADFSNGLRKTLILPAAVAHRPNPALIKKANAHRGFIFA
jgi:putative restriction endonuclease